MKPKSDKPSEHGRESRLDSWKKIAAYLNRDVRTAHRWEKYEDLPVHRHQHSKRGTVYAYPAEIDAWLAQRSSAENSELLTVTLPRPKLVISAVALALIVGTTAVFLFLESGPSESAQTARLLIASTVNRTAEDRFDGVVDAYLESEMSSARTQVIPPSRIIETLALMRAPADSDLDIALMLEVAARNPDADLIVTSTLDRFGSEYAFTVEILDPISGAVLEAIRSQASVEDEIPVALESLVAGALASVNNIELPERAPHMGYERVTAASLRAAELYWDATLLMFNSPYQMPAAEEQLREAVALDPEFASAYIQLAHAIHEQGRPAIDWADFAERAVMLADTVSAPERYFIVGSYHKLHGNLSEAHAQFLVIEESHPEHFWGQFHMAEVSHARGNLEGAAWSMALAADLKPRSIALHYAAFDFILTTPHPWNLPRIHARLFDLNRPSGNGNVHPFFPAEFYVLNQLLMTGDSEAALAELRQLRQKLAGFPDDVWTRRSEYAARLAEQFVTLGRLEEAEELLQIIRDDDADEIRNSPLIRQINEQRVLGLLSVVRNQDCCPDTGSGPPQLREFAILAARSGQTEFGDTNIGILIRSDTGFSRILRGVITLEDGDRDVAIELLSAELNAETDRLRNLGLAPGLASPTRGLILLAADLLATALIDAGRTTDAIRVLEQWSGERAKVAAFMSSPPYAPYWIQLRWKLEGLYRQSGRTEAANSIRSYLESLLALADDDHAIAQSLRSD